MSDSEKVAEPVVGTEEFTIPQFDLRDCCLIWDMTEQFHPKSGVEIDLAAVLRAKLRPLIAEVMRKRKPNGRIE